MFRADSRNTISRPTCSFRTCQILERCDGAAGIPRAAICSLGAWEGGSSASGRRPRGAAPGAPRDRAPRGTKVAARAARGRGCPVPRCAVTPADECVLIFPTTQRPRPRSSPHASPAWQRLHARPLRPPPQAQSLERRRLPSPPAPLSPDLTCRVASPQAPGGAVDVLRGSRPQLSTCKSPLRCSFCSEPLLWPVTDQRQTQTPLITSMSMGMGMGMGIGRSWAHGLRGRTNGRRHSSITSYPPSSHAVFSPSSRSASGISRAPRRRRCPRHRRSTRCWTVQ